jgi:hypothetical protein
VISDFVSLSDKLAALMLRLVAEDGAIDPRLARVVDELTPDEESIGVPCAEHEFVAWPDELPGRAAASPRGAGVVPVEQLAGAVIAVLG